MIGVLKTARGRWILDSFIFLYSLSSIAAFVSLLELNFQDFLDLFSPSS